MNFLQLLQQRWQARQSNNKSIPKLMYLMLTMCLTCLIDDIETVAVDLTKYTRDS